MKSLVLPKHGLNTLQTQLTLHSKDLPIPSTQTQQLLQVVHRISGLQLAVK